MNRAWIDPKPVVTSIPAIIIPTAMRPRAFQYFTPNKYAIRLPVHDPDPGSGIATKIMMKTLPYWANFSLCLFLVFSNNVSKSRSRGFECFLRKVTMGSRILRIIIFGIKFPTIPIKKASSGGSPILIPMGIPSLNSTPGSIDPKNVAVSGVRKSCSIVV